MKTRFFKLIESGVQMQHEEHNSTLETLLKTCKYFHHDKRKCCMKYYKNLSWV